MRARGRPRIHHRPVTLLLRGLLGLRMEPLPLLLLAPMPLFIIVPLPIVPIASPPLLLVLPSPALIPRLPSPPG